jgi:hypothetical protein
MVLARAITSGEDGATYAFFWEQYFKLLHQCVGFKLQVKHIHGHGLLGITIDQDWGEIVGEC